MGTVRSIVLVEIFGKVIDKLTCVFDKFNRVGNKLDRALGKPGTGIVEVE